MNLRNPRTFFGVYTAGLLLAVSVLYSVGLVLEIYQASPSWWTKLRIEQSLQFLSSPAAQQKPLILALGASEMQSGINPMEIDRRLREQNVDVLTLNLGTENVGSFLPLYIDRLKTELKRNGLKPRMIVVHLPPARLTERSLQGEATTIKYSDIPTVLYDSQLLFTHSADWEEKLIATFNKLLLRGHSLLQVQTFFARISLIKDRKTAAQKAFFQLLGSGRYRRLPAWDPSLQGFFDFNREHYAEEIETLERRMRKPKGMLDVITKLDLCCDFMGLNISQVYLKKIVVELRALREQTEKMAIVTFPESPQVFREPEVDARADEIFKKVALNTNSEFWDLEEESDLSDRDNFLDPTHLSALGVDRMSQTLARRIVQALH